MFARICEGRQRSETIFEALPQAEGLTLMIKATRLTDGWMDGWTDRWTDGWMDGRMDGWTDGWMDGRTDG